MSNLVSRLATAALVSVTLASGSLVAASPAQAQSGGQISFNIAPSNAEEDQWMRAGLEIYSLVNELQSGSITQNGSRNAAGLGQNGWGNRGVIHQDGNGHEGSINQNGNGNSYGLFQFGDNTRSHVTQNGNGGTGLGFVFGW